MNQNNLSIEQIVVLIPKDASASEKWILLNLFLYEINKKKAAKVMDLSLRRVQQVAKKFAIC